MARCANLPEALVTPPHARLLPLTDTRTLELTTRPEEVARGRRWATDEAARLGASEETIFTVELLASEVLTNAVRYGTEHGAVRMVVARVGDTLRLAVSDAGDDLPKRRNPGLHALGGRGLQILDRLASGWGTQSYPTGGKCVWLTVPLAADADERKAAA